MSTPQVEPASPSWTLTKVVALVVAILSAGYMLPWAIAAIRDVPHWTVFWVTEARRDESSKPDNSNIANCYRFHGRNAESHAAPLRAVVEGVDFLFFAR